MTEKRANEILRTKYPEAEIFNGKRYGGATSSEMVVIFTPCGKSYHYQASTYQQVLEKLGFNILYKHNVVGIKREIESLKKEIEDGGFEDLFTDGFITFTEEQINEKKAQIAKLENVLATAIID